MSNFVIITVATKECFELQMLRKSCSIRGYDLVVLGLDQEWRGFGMKVILTREYLLQHPEITYFMFVDAYDVLLLHKLIRIPDHILFSTEKGCWPDHDAPYPHNPGHGEWRYLNSGSYIAPRTDYLDMVDKFPIEYSDDDQRYFTNIYLKTDRIKLDFKCEIFQSFAFNYTGQVRCTGNHVHNNVYNTYPPIIHFNGKCLDKQIYSMMKYNSLADLKAAWKDHEDVHKDIHESFISATNGVDELRTLRDYVEQNIYGFGERSFYWMWWLIMNDIPDGGSFLEIGVFKGQTLTLVGLIAWMKEQEIYRSGVTPLSTEGGVWESDYENDIKHLHKKFKVSTDYHLFKGLSEDPSIVEAVYKYYEGIGVDVLYIDGGHEERHIRNDIEKYSPLVNVGGYLVIDDCCNTFSMPFGYFCGIESVTRVVDELLPPRGQNGNWEFIGSVVHNRIYKRI